MTRPAQVFHVWDFVSEELVARGWDADELALRMGGPWGRNRLVIDFMSLQDNRIVLDQETANGLARAFGTSAEVWLNLDKTWREWAKPQSN